MRLGVEAGEHTLDLAVELGIRGVPIGADQLVGQGVERCLAPLKDRGLQVCQIGAFGYNPLSSDQPGQAAQSELLKKAIPLAVHTGCAYIVIGPGNYHPSGFGVDDRRNHTEAALNRLAEALLPMLELAAKYGVNLSFEPYLKGAVNGPRSFLALWERLKKPNLRANVDPSSLYNYEDLLDPRERVEQVCFRLAGHYGLVHLKEIALQEGFHIQAGLAPIGRGRTDWAQMLGLIAPRVPEDSWVILEHVQTPEEGRNSFRLLGEAAKKAGVVLE
jgi:sugar phosphate isomerase/epimerase